MRLIFREEETRFLPTKRPWSSCRGAVSWCPGSVFCAVLPRRPHRCPWETSPSETGAPFQSICCVAMSEALSYCTTKVTLYTARQRQNHNLTSILIKFRLSFHISLFCFQIHRNKSKHERISACGPGGVLRVAYDS